MRRLSATISPMLRAVEWLFSPAAPGVDLFLGGVATAWAGMMIGRPELFDHGNYAGMQWAPDWFWIAYVVIIAASHGLALVYSQAVKIRVATCLGASWYWILIAISLSRPGLTTGSWTYSLIGVMALASAIYISGRLPRPA